MPGTSDFVGTWKLLSFESEEENGRIEHPFGTNITGFLAYCPDGNMNVNIMMNDRLKFKSGDLTIASEEEMKSSMFYIGYAGRYEIQDGFVLHHIDVSFFPNWVGQTQKRLYSLGHGELTLETEPMNALGRLKKFRLVWKHV